MALGSVTFGGLASGLPADIVDQLMKAEQTRMVKLQTNQAVYTQQKSAVSDFKSKLLALKSKAESLKDPALFRPHTVTSSDTAVLTATASSDAMAATHTIQVNAIAKNNTWAQGTANAATSSTATTTAVTSPLTITYNGTAYNTTITTGMTMSDIAAAINTDTTLNPSTTTGVDASVLYDGSKYRLVLRAKDAGLNGAAARIAMTSGSMNFGSGAINATSFTEKVAGVNASLLVDGVTVTSTSNSVSTALTGVTLNLLKADVGVNKTVSIANDTDTLKTTLNDFMKSFNDIVSFVNTEAAKGGRLAKDASMARSVLAQLKAELHYATQAITPTGGPYSQLTPYSMLAEIGVRTSSSDGTLSLDETGFSTAIAKGFDSIASLFTVTPIATDYTNFMTTFGAKRGLAYRLNDLLQNVTNITGSPVSSKLEGMDTRLKRVQDQMDREQARLDKVREQLTLKFAKLEQLTSAMQGQGSSLQQALSGLNG
ncbi:MAG: flagellar filament capping protein FliD [Magnetococcales bacterium]|nr:flagellar filament capping protein FliD [Magnetococcales bacterium]MBF0321813.1 flagellar filament capping protein FliD [Magnetococcales bacterium]